MISIRHLEILRTLHEHRHFGRAAAALGVSQPSLTRSLKGLEDALGVVLIDRQGVSPTIFGEILLKHGHSVLANLDELQHEIAMARGLDVGEVRVAMGPYPADISGYRAIGLLSQHHPRLAIELSVKNWYAAVDDVVNNRADLAIADITEAASNPALTIEALRISPLSFFCSSSHPLARQADVVLADVLGYPWVGPSLARSLHKFLPVDDKPFGLFEPDLDRFRPRILVETFGAAKEVVSMGQAISAAIPQQIAREIKDGSFVFLPLPLPWLRLNYGFISKRGRTPTPAAMALMEIMRSLEAGFQSGT